MQGFDPHVRLPTRHCHSSRTDASQGSLSSNDDPYAAAVQSLYTQILGIGAVRAGA